MEGALNPYIKERTHNFIVPRHLNWDDLNFVAITPKGSIVVFRDRTDWSLHAVFNAFKGRYHVHIPYDADIIPDYKEAEDVLKEVFECLQYAECYVDNTNEIKETIGYSMIYNMNPILLRRFTPKPFAYSSLIAHSGVWMNKTFICAS